MVTIVCQELKKGEIDAQKKSERKNSFGSLSLSPKGGGKCLWDIKLD
jgi:hypothetical protein